jgi:hypothetical protein
MLKWLTTRLRRDSVAPLERAPSTNHVVARSGISPRRGVTLRPMALVKFENRQRNRTQRDARRINR